MQSKGFIVVQMRDKLTYLVMDCSTIAVLVGAHARTVRKWFSGNEKFHIYKDWMITKGYEVIKSKRGGQGFKVKEKAIV